MPELDLAAWQKTATEGRPVFRPKGERSELSTQRWKAAKNGSEDSFANACVRAIPGGIPVDAEWSIPVSCEEETVSVCSFVVDGVSEAVAFHRIYDWTAPLWRTAEGYVPVHDATETEILSFLADVVDVDDGQPHTVSCLDGMWNAGDLAISVRGHDIPVPFDGARVFFVNDKPGAGWEHPARLVFVKRDLSAFVIRFVNFPPAFRAGADGGELFMHRIWPTANESSPADMEAVKRAVFKNAAGMKSNAISFSGLKDNSYFIVFAGGANPANNGVRFWSDAASMYSTITKKYGVAKSHVKLYHGYGTSSTPDVNLYGSPEDGIRLVSAPKDMDGDGTSDITGAATSSNLRSALASYASSLSSSDQLFVFITGHGSGSNSASDYDSEILGFNSAGTDTITDKQLADWSKNIPCPVFFVFENCYSGGMLDDIVATANRVGASAATHYEVSYGAPDYTPGAWYNDTSGMTGEFNYFVAMFTSAVRGCNPITVSGFGYPWTDDSGAVDANTDSDSKVSVREAFEWAKANDKAAKDGKEHPQFRESSSGIGNSVFVLKQTGTTGTRTLNDAVDNYDLTITTGGDAGWSYQVAESFDGVDAARSGLISHNQTTWMAASGVSGPGIISFRWKVSSESGYDKGQFDVDGDWLWRWSGTENGWRYEAVRMGSGAHSFKWTYFKDVSDVFDTGSDCLLVDQVKWTPGSPLYPVYRFYSKNYRGHFYTMDADEMSTVVNTNPNWNYEGVAYFAYPSQNSGTTGLYRFYSSLYRGHFYTTDYAEYLTVRNTNPNWRYEGIAYYVRPSAGSGAKPVYRFWSKGYRHHFYTMDYNEYWTVRTTNPNWSYEGIAFYAWETPESLTSANSTASKAENVASVGGTASDGADGPGFDDGISAGAGKTVPVGGTEGVFPVGAWTVEVRFDAPDAAEIAEAEAIPFDGLVAVPELEVALPADTAAAAIWSATAGTIAEEENPARAVIVRPSAMDDWTWVRAFDADGAETVSLWLRLLP